MQYQVFVQNQSDQRFIASVLGLPNLTAEGQTEAEAISNIKTALEAQLATGKWITIEVTPETQPIQPSASLEHAGILEHDPTFEDFMEKLTKIRQDANQVSDPE